MIVRGIAFENQIVKRNAIVFGLLAIGFQTLVGFMYGFFINYLIIGPGLQNYTAPASIFFLMLLLIVGFGLLSTYIKTTAWSGLGYALLIMAITTQLYFLINAFYTKLQVQRSINTFSTREYNFVSISYFNQATNNVLSNINAGAQIFTLQYGANCVQAFKCAISVFVAFMAVAGRVGPAEVFMLTVCTVIGYELNNQVLRRINTVQEGGSMAIFLYGATVGICASVCLGKRNTTQNHPKYRSDRQGMFLGLLGTVFIWVLFPGIVFGSLDSKYSTPFLGAAPLAIWLSLASSTVTTFAVSILIHHKIGVYDVVFGSLAGPIAFSTSSTLILHPVAPLCAGVFGGVTTTLMLAYLNRRINRRGIIQTYPVIEVFWYNGFAGGIWSSVYTAFQGGYYIYNIPTYTYPIDTSNWKQGGLQISGTFISIGIGIVLGLIAGVFIHLLNYNTAEDQFDDGTYWTIEDYGLQKTMLVEERVQLAE